MMNTTPIVSQTLQEKVFEKIRSSIGELLTEEDLKLLVSTAVERIFFSERIIKENYREYTKEPEINDIVSKLIKSRIDAEVKNWLAEHNTEVMKIVKEQLDKGILEIVTASINAFFASQMYGIKENIRQALVALQEQQNRY